LAQRIVDRGTYKALSAFARDRLDAERRRLREPDVLDAHLLDEELLDPLILRGAGEEFDAGVDVLRVLPEDDHVDQPRLLDGRGHAGVPAHGANAGVKVELLPQGNVERTDTAADRRGQRALDGYEMLGDDVERLLGQ